MPSDPKPAPRVKKKPRQMRQHSLTNSVAVAWRTLYLPAREMFLKRHPWCEMHVLGHCARGRHEATEVQHMIQRSLDPSIENLLDEAHWIPSCHKANAWCGIHPIEAQALGLEISPKERAS